jgi:hypothetical protein
MGLSTPSRAAYESHRSMPGNASAADTSAAWDARVAEPPRSSGAQTPLAGAAWHRAAPPFPDSKATYAFELSGDRIAEAASRREQPWVGSCAAIARQGGGA